MEEVIVYLLKSSGLIAAFYLSYHLLLRKETFFTANRWFLLTGLLSSVLLPLFFIKKIIWLETHKVVPHEFVMQATPSFAQTPIVPVAEPFDWLQFLAIGYALIAGLLAIKIILNFILLYRMLHGQKIIKNGPFKLVDYTKNTAPFSFFNYIVYNSDLYSSSELQSILSHEQIHSREKHSIDVVVAEFFCALFWFNPFVWLYKKAITQNLEYIADHKAIAQLDDKISYQHALLKVVSHQNCLPITNNFYQSLIKKRIVMLNKNQSHSRNSFKYAMMIPILTAFVFLFQIKVEAKERLVTTPRKIKIVNENPIESTPVNAPIPNIKEGNVAYVFDKISSDNELNEAVSELKNDYNITLKVSNLKRNEAGEIIAIKLTFDDHKGNKGTTLQDRTIAIRPIFFKVSQVDGKTKIGFYDNSDMVEKEFDAVNETKITMVESIKEDALIYVDGQRYTKADLNELDPKGLEKIEILKDAKSLEEYGAKDKKEVVVITTNWTTKPTTPITKPNTPSVSIITLANGDEVVMLNRYSLKLPGYPNVTFTDNYPVLVFNGKPQNNPRLSLESIDVTKIKTIKVLNEKEEEVKGTPVYKIIVSTK